MKTDLITQSLAWVLSPDYLDLTSRQFALLGILCDQPERHHVRDLARKLAVSKPVISRASTLLAWHGLVIRQRGEDRRDCILVATDAGRALRARFATNRVALEQAA